MSKTTREIRIPSDGPERNRLLLAKQLFRHGVQRSHDPDNLSRVLAILSLHAAVETTVKAICLQYNVRREKALNISFEDLTSEVERHFEANDPPPARKLPFRTDMRNQFMHRNLAQHHGQAPSPEVLEDSRVLTRRFLIQVFTQYFGLDFESLSEVSFITDARLRHALEMAEGSLRKEDWENAALAATLAFRWAESELPSVVSLTPALRRQPISPFRLSDLASASDEGEGLRRLAEAFKTLVEHVGALTTAAATGISLSELTRFYRKSPPVQISLSGNWVVHRRRKVSSEDAGWLVQFAIQALLTLQTQGFNPQLPESAGSGYAQLIAELQKDQT